MEVDGIKKEEPAEDLPPPGSVLSPPGHRPNDHQSHIGKRVKVFLESQKRWYRGTIKNYKELKYEIGYDEGENLWESEEDLIFINSDEEREGIQRRREKVEKKRKLQRKRGG